MAAIVYFNSTPLSLSSSSSRNSCLPHSNLPRKSSGSRRPRLLPIVVAAAPANGEEQDSAAKANFPTLDRREILAGGLAGALSATNVVHAAPVGDPVLKRCGPANVSTQKGQIFVACCAPKPRGAPIDFKPDTGPMRVRPAAHLIDEDYIAKYNLAYQKMRELPADDPRSFQQQANVHCAYCNYGYQQEDKNKLQIHFSWLFLPWHRYYLHFHEKILGSLIGDPTFALPFWNWDNQKGGQVMPEYFMREGTALYDVNRNFANAPPMPVKLSFKEAITDPDEIKLSNLAVMNQTVANTTERKGFMGGDYRKGDPDPTGNDGSLEKTPHTAVHIFGGSPKNLFGEDMGNFYSAGRDPLFYCHHSNVDRMWTVWKEKLGNTDFDDADFLNAEFLFFDENQDLVKCKVKDCLNTEEKMRYKYDDAPDEQWINYKRPIGNPARNVASLVPQNTAIAAEYQELGPASGNSTLITVAGDPVVVTVKQPKNSGGGKDEVLVLENLTVAMDTRTGFEVFIDFPQANQQTSANSMEYVGSFLNLPHFMPGMKGDMTRSTNARFSIKQNVEALKLTDSDKITVTIVPNRQDPQPTFTIKGASIVSA